MKRFTRLFQAFIGIIAIGANLAVATSSEASDCTPTANANLSSCDYTGMDLTNANLTNANLTNANLTNANLTNANLTNANLTNANLTNANLTNANLTNANLTGATIRNVDLTGAILFGIKARNLKSALIPVKLPDQWVWRSGFFLGPGVDLSGTTPPNLAGLNLQSANLSNTNLANNSFCGSDLTQANLEGATFSRTLFVSSVINRTDCQTGTTRALPDAILLGVKSGRITQTVKLSTPTLPNKWMLIGGYLVGPGTNLSGADLTGLDLSASTLDGVISSGIIGFPKLPQYWRLANGVLVGPPHFILSPTPSIVGTPKVGSTFSVNLGIWKPSPSKFEYFWQLVCPDGIYPLGTSKTQAIGEGVGCSVRLTITATKVGYQYEQRIANSSSLAAGIFTKQTPVISDVPVVGKVLTVKMKAWNPTPNLVSYEWLVDGTVTATGSTLTVLPTDVGKKIAVRVTCSADSYTTETVLSKSTSIVKLR